MFAERHATLVVGSKEGQKEKDKECGRRLASRERVWWDSTGVVDVGKIKYYLAPTLDHKKINNSFQSIFLVEQDNESSTAAIEYSTTRSDAQKKWNPLCYSGQDIGSANKFQQLPRLS